MYVFFEKVVIVNYSPVVDGELSPSFPSSHTLLACTVFATLAPELKRLFNNKWINNNMVMNNINNKNNNNNIMKGKINYSVIKA